MYTVLSSKCDLRLDDADLWTSQGFMSRLRQRVIVQAADSRERTGTTNMEKYYE